MRAYFLGSDFLSMKRSFSVVLSSTLAIAFAFLAAPGRLHSQDAPQPEAAKPKSPFVDASDTRPAEQAYKNIQIFKGMPANRIEGVMRGFRSALGVQCTYCHVRGQFDSDEVEHKEVARAMKKMTDELAQNHFKGESKVTCYSCHRGEEQPARLPPAEPRQRRPQNPTPAPQGQ